MPAPRGDRRLAAIMNSKRAKWKNVRFRDNSTVKASDTWALNECWCGEPQDHDWPGRDEGKPHPVPGFDREMTPHERKREEWLALQAAGVCPNCRGYPEGKTKDGHPWCRTCLGSGVFPPPTHSEVLLMRQEAKRAEE